MPSVVAPPPTAASSSPKTRWTRTAPATSPADRILCIHPDGKVTVFADKLYAVFGIAYYDGKLFVHHSPKFTVFNDDVDIRHRQEPRRLLRHRQPRHLGRRHLNDHIPAQIRLGMDGWFYMSSGDKGVYGLVSKIDGSKAELRGGGVIRFRPDGTHFEVYATGTRNHLDISINAEDEIFSYDNTDDGLGWNTRFTHFVDGGYYGYPYDYRPNDDDPEGMARRKASNDAVCQGQAEYDKNVKEATKDAKTDEEKAAIVAKADLTKPSSLVPPFQPYTLWAMDDFGGGSPTGAIAYNEDALPEEYRGNLFHCEWGKKQFERIVVERSGATYKIAKRDDKFLKGGTAAVPPAGNHASRPTAWASTSATGTSTAGTQQAGRRPIDEAQLHRQAHADPQAGLVRTRRDGPEVRRVHAGTHRRPGPPRPERPPGRQPPHRRARRRAPSAPLISLLNDNTAPNYARWHAIWTLDRINDGKAGRDAIIAVLTNPQVDVSIRMQAARQLGTRQAAKEAVPAADRRPERPRRRACASAPPPRWAASATRRPSRR